MSLQRAEVAEAAFGVCLGMYLKHQCWSQKGLGVVLCRAIRTPTATTGDWEQYFTVFITDIMCHLKGLGILLGMSVQ